MKYNIIEGNILDATDPIVAHCCNTQNTMNSGVARALRDKYPEVYETDKGAYITFGKELLGRCELVPVVTAKEKIDYIANLYGQPNYGYDGARYVDYEAFYQSLEALRNEVALFKFKSLGMPFKIASDRAGGYWLIILEMIKHVFENTEITINFYKLNETIPKS